MPGGSRWYYEIGGAKPLSLPPTNQLVFGAEASFGHGLGDTCRKFDPAAALKAAFRGTLEQIEAFAVSTASNALIGLPLYLLAQADPQLYDLLKDGLWKADALFRLSAKTCEEMMRDIGEGRNPYEDFVILSRAKDVQLRANSGLDDLNTAIRDANGDQGLPWVNGEWRGGRNAPPINIISDTAVAGYNVLVGRNPADLGGIGGEASTQPLVAIWPSAADCANWITDVLGDESVRTYDAGARSSRPGRGILPKHDEIVSEVRAAFESILPSETPLSAEQLSAVSAPGIQITLDLIKRLRVCPRPRRPLPRHGLPKKWRWRAPSSAGSTPSGCFSPGAASRTSPTLRPEMRSTAPFPSSARRSKLSYSRPTCGISSSPTPHATCCCSGSKRARARRTRRYPLRPTRRSCKKEPSVNERIRPCIS